MVIVIDTFVGVVCGALTIMEAVLQSLPFFFLAAPRLQQQALEVLEQPY
jgi:hypothetical protein